MPRPFGTIGETKLKILAIICSNEVDDRPTYGYDVWKVLKKVFHSYLNPGDLRNIYRHLKDLENMGMIKKGTRQTAKGVPARQTYRLTEKGRALKEKFAAYLEVLEKSSEQG
jgi:DNA-binding PadR family transcriptional regulator